MIKNNQKRLNRIHVLIDAAVIAASYSMAWYLKFVSRFFEAKGAVLPYEQYMMALFLVIPGYLLLYSFFQLYTPKRLSGRRAGAGSIVRANTIGLLIFILILYLGFRDVEFSREMLFVFYCVNVINEIIVRNIIRFLLHKIRKKGYNLKHILLVGYSRAAEGFIDRVDMNPQWGYKIRGILDDSMEEGNQYKGVRVLGGINELLEILSENTLDEIAITLGLSEYSKLEYIVEQCEKSGVHTKFIPDYNSILPTRPYTEDLQGLPVVNIRKVPLNRMYNKAVKRTIDIAGSVAALILFSPVMLLTMLLIKLTSPGPLIFTQERVGLHNETFKMYKFRSMEVQSEKSEKKAWTTKNDSRVTGIGKFIRKTRIDELPQLINVLKGDMSMVGPRPERPYFVDKFKEEIPRYMIKHQVRPGMTGWAQVNGYRGNTSIKRRVAYDLYYIENWTIGFDFKILFMTVFKGFVNKNAY